MSNHNIDVIMTTMASQITSLMSQITSLTVVYSFVYSGADQRKHQSGWGLCDIQPLCKAIVSYWLDDVELVYLKIWIKTIYMKKSTFTHLIS